MTTPTMTTYYKFANLQMAAEAFLDRIGQFTFQQVLEEGNHHSSKFPTILAEQFAADWKVIAHQPNTSTGFSGTLFECQTDDPARGLVKGELTLSIRSTEFLDDRLQDNFGANKDIYRYGFAFGQIADMMDWYKQLKTSGLLPDNAQFNVTGYSLGGHLTNALNMMLLESNEQARVIHTYNFNGAGTGQVLAGHNLHEAMQNFALYQGSSVDDNIQRALFDLPPEVATYIVK